MFKHIKMQDGGSAHARSKGRRYRHAPLSKLPSTGTIGTVTLGQLFIF